MYGLTRLIVAKSPFVEVTEEQYNAGLRARTCAWQALEIEEKFDLLLSNYEEFEQTILRVALQASMYARKDWSASVDTSQQVNRRLVNLLSTCRLYLDQIAHNLSRMYGEDSAPLSRVRTSCTEEYDNRLGYRTMEALRNYVQHRGMPIQRMSLESIVIPEASNVRMHVRYTVGLSLGVVQLREDGGFKAQILEELSRLGDWHDLKAMLRDYIVGLGSVHEAFRSAVSSDLEKSDAIIAEFLARYRAAGGETIALGLVRTDGETFGDTNRLTEDPITRRRALAAKNRQTKAFPNAVVTNY